MSGKTVRPWQTSHPLFAVIIHDFPAGLSESEKPSASVFLHDPDQCLRLILAGRLLSHPGTNVVDSGEIMTNVHAPGIVPEIFSPECSASEASAGKWDFGSWKNRSG